MSSPEPLSDAWFFRLVDAAELIEDDDPYAHENYVDDAKVSALLRAAVAEALEWAAARCRTGADEMTENFHVERVRGAIDAQRFHANAFCAKAQEVRDGAA